MIDHAELRAIAIACMTDEESFESIEDFDVERYRKALEVLAVTDKSPYKDVDVVWVARQALAGDAERGGGDG